jgi:hypothetical protein
MIDEIIRKQEECCKQGYKLASIFINPIDLVNLLYDQRFLDTARYGNKTSIDPGEVGKFLGVSIISSPNVPLHKLLFHVKMGNYSSMQEGESGNLNPSRRDNRNGRLD